MANNYNDRPNILSWGCLIGLISAIFLAVLGGLWLFQQDGNSTAAPYPTPIIRTATITPSPTPLPVLPTSTPAPDEASAGQQVIVVGTGDVGLSMRAEPGTAAERINVANENEIFDIIDGPIESDGYTWWLISDPENADRQGWAVDDFLQMQP